MQSETVLYFHESDLMRKEEIDIQLYSFKPGSIKQIQKASIVIYIYPDKSFKVLKSRWVDLMGTHHPTLKTKER